MPQEIRHPEFRTEKSSELAIKLLSADAMLRSFMGSEFHQKMALDSFWPDRTQEEEQMLIQTTLEVNRIQAEYSEMFRQNEYAVRQNRIH